MPSLSGAGLAELAVGAILACRKKKGVDPGKGDYLGGRVVSPTGSESRISEDPVDGYRIHERR